MSENSSNEQLNSSENDEDFRVSALLLRTDIKRRIHNGIEKRRKDKINHWIHKLAELLPYKEPKPKSKTHLLETIYQYINQLKERNDGLMFGGVNTINTIHVEEIRRLTKRCKELEEKNINYYRLLETAGISPNSWPSDIPFERPTKYSKKISEQQLNEFLVKSSEKKSDKNKDNNKRNNESDENSGQSSNKRFKSKRSRKRKDRDRGRNFKCSPPTPVLPKTTEQLSPMTNTTTTSFQSISSGQTTTSGQIVLLNDQNMSTVSGIDETPKFIVNTNNGFNGLNTIQFRPTVGPQQLQILSTAPTIDTLNANNRLSGQLLFNLNPPAPQPQATAVLLPNGQILPIITQSQSTQPQPLILTPNQSFVLTTQTAQTHQTISGQTTATLSSNIQTNSINNSSKNTNESKKPKPVSEEKSKKMTTTIETIVSETPVKKKINKSIKKQIFSPKAKNSKKDKRKQEVVEKEEKSTKSEIIDGKIAPKESETKNSKTSDKTTDEKPVISNKEKNKIKSRSCDKSSNEKKRNENIVNSVKNMKNSKSKAVLTAMSETPDKKIKESSNCDILAKATQSIFSPPPNTCAKHEANGGNKKEVSVNNKTKDNNKWSGSRKDITINDNNIKSSNKCKNVELESNRLKSESVIKSNEIEVISEYCANSSADSSANTSETTSANITNKANIELINDTNKNDNYVHNRTTSEENSKIEKTIASGNKAEINKKSVNNLNNSNAITSSGVSSARNTTSLPNKLTNGSTPERTTIQANACQPNANHQPFPQQNVSTNSGSDNNRLSFGFNSQQNQTNSNSIPNNVTNGESQAVVSESELPSILLSLNDANEVSAESVHSVSNSSLPAFLSLSPEHLNEYLPKDNITNNTETETSNRDQTLPSDGNAVQFRISPNHSNIEQLAPVRPQESNRHHLQKEQQNYGQYPKTNESSAANTQTESRSAYTSNFPTISSLITNDYSDFPLTPNKSMFVSNNSTNYFDNFNPNPLMNPKMSSQNNNFLQFPLQNDNSLMPLYPMHSYPIHNYLQNNTNSNTTNNVNRDPNSNTNRNTFFTPNESQLTEPYPSTKPVPQTSVANTTPKVSQNLNQSHTQSQTRSQTTALTPQQSKTTPTPPHSTPTQTQNQSNSVMPMRSQRNTSTEQQIPPQQRHSSQQHTTPVSSNTNSSNKTNSNSSSVQYSTHNSFSSYSAEALIRQNEPTVQQIQSNEQNRYNSNTSASVAPRIAQQPHNSANLTFNSERHSSRASISYSAESLIQSNPMNNSNQMSNKSSQREVESESLNAVNDNNRISYYQHNSHPTVNNSSNTSNNLVQRTDQNNLFNFDNSLNSRITSSASNSISQNCGNSYPQITFSSHLPDIRTSTATTSSESLFQITPNTTPTTVNTNSNRTLSTNSISNNNNNTNSSVNSNTQSSHTVSNMGGTQSQPQPQHSPAIYPSNNSQNSNSQQTKRSSNNNSFNPGVNAFIHSNADNYLNASHSSMYSTSAPPLVDPNLNPNPNQYQRSSRNSDLRFGNCLQPSNQNTTSSAAQHNNPNTNCFFPNTAPNTTYFPTSSGTPFPPLLPPSAPSPFDGTAPFSATHRPPMFPNSFIPDFNASFVNTGTNAPLPPITGSNFNINPAISNTSNTSNKREAHPSNTRSSSTMNRSPNQSKHSKISANSSNASNTKTKKQNNSKHNESSNNSSSRHSNDNYFSMTELAMSSTIPTNPSHNRYPNFMTNTQNHSHNRQPIPSPTVSSGHSTNVNNKNVTSSADTSSYPIFRPQSQNVNNSSNVSNSANFSVNSLQNSNRSVPTTSAQTTHFSSSSGGHHSSHATNFHLSNIFPDINSNNSESLGLSPMKFAPPVTPVAPPPVGPPLSQVTAMDPNPYPNHHSSGHHQNIYHSHHSSARISTPHNAFNSFLSSGTTSTHNPNNHPFDPHITPNNRAPNSTQMSGIGANSSHSTSTLGATHPHSHHSYPNFSF